MILPNSNAWKRIALGLLMGGQAYRKMGEGGKSKTKQLR
jgi:hypothetical protein